MPDRRGRKARSEDFLPAERVRWARQVWADRKVRVQTDAGVRMLREAAKVLGLPEETVDELLRRS